MLIVSLTHPAALLPPKFADSGITKTCPLQDFVNADQLCLRKIVSSAIPANKSSVQVGSSGLVNGAANYCPGGWAGPFGASLGGGTALLLLKAGDKWPRTTSWAPSSSSLLAAEGATGISSGLTATGQLRVQCVLPCPSSFYPRECGGYCAIDSSVICPPDPGRILGNVAQCEDFEKVKVLG